MCVRGDETLKIERGLKGAGEAEVTRPQKVFPSADENFGGLSVLWARRGDVEWGREVGLIHEGSAGSDIAAPVSGSTQKISTNCLLGGLKEEAGP